MKPLMETVTVKEADNKLDQTSYISKASLFSVQ